MSKYQTQLSLTVPLESVQLACREAISALGWKVLKDSAQGISCQEITQQPLSFTNPVQVQITFKLSKEQTLVLLNSSNFGFGPFQSSHVKTQTETLARLIQQKATTIPKTRNKDLKASASSSKTSSTKPVVINQQVLSSEEMQQMEKQYGIQLYPGEYWYDARTGAWGYWGGATAGFILSNLPLKGTLPENASQGNTNVFINGRHLPIADVIGLKQILPVVLPGRYWMDVQGNFGLENGPILGNIWLLAKNSGVKREGILSTYDKTGIAVIGGS